MMKPTLDQVIAAFAAYAERKGWHTYEGAFNHCGEASASFCTAIRFHCLPVEVGLQQLEIGKGMPVYSRRMHVPELCGLEVTWTPKAGDHHIVARIGDHYYDWTRRQYQPDAAFPHVATQPELEAEGWIFLL